MSDSQQVLVVLDVETTGLRPEEGHEIIEVAVQKIQDRQVIGEFVSLVATNRIIDAETEKVHGITNALLAVEGKPASEVFPKLIEFIGTAPIVGHNVGFDMAFINSHLKRLDLPILDNPLLDTIAQAKRLLLIPSYSLEKVAAYFKIPQPQAHRAKADVETTREVFWKLVERAKQQKA
ncbi:3'-5' exonuclease [Candidatus Parcubacteria bacterium]|jgi:DNA polymerase-3 subunit epsilon|nr:MAG: 3'-5' exonuclease [Candidatus Parcubacteria bacterium]